MLGWYFCSMVVGAELVAGTGAEEPICSDSGVKVGRPVVPGAAVAPRPTKMIRACGASAGVGGVRTAAVSEALKGWEGSVRLRCPLMTRGHTHTGETDDEGTHEVGNAQQHSTRSRSVVRLRLVVVCRGRIAKCSVMSRMHRSGMIPMRGESEANPTQERKLTEAEATDGEAVGDELLRHVGELHRHHGLHENPVRRGSRWVGVLLLGRSTAVAVGRATAYCHLYTPTSLIQSTALACMTLPGRSGRCTARARMPP